MCLTHTSSQASDKCYFFGFCARLVFIILAVSSLAAGPLNFNCLLSAVAMDVKREKEIAGVILFLARQVEIVFFYAILCNFVRVGSYACSSLKNPSGVQFLAIVVSPPLSRVAKALSL